MEDDIFEENIEPEDDIFEMSEDEEPITLPIGELIFHQVMTAVSSALFPHVQIFNELGTVKLVDQSDIQLFLIPEDEEEGEEG